MPEKLWGHCPDMEELYSLADEETIHYCNWSDGKPLAKGERRLYADCTRESCPRREQIEKMMEVKG